MDIRTYLCMLTHVRPFFFFFEMTKKKMTFTFSMHKTTIRNSSFFVFMILKTPHVAARCDRDWHSVHL